MILWDISVRTCRKSAEDRHEILNELDYEQVQMDILSFIEKRLEALEA